ncbi:hypothetical protein PR202_gb16665 [Eleusine coracana subsp. coracana]|uniref:Uncharacterized protein n=1 Tax=Eleusine coracana subsp. coracana TaxID=191504 RepID=A0AAV5F100_ELECO|nr:hypothetical protein PR202_gb16665 [Eleusine coracana subsp. coracana]
MTSPRHIPAAAAGPGNKENISENGATLLDCPAEVAFSAKGKKQPTGVLDSSELSVLTGSELMANGTPSSGISGIMMPLCRSRKYDNINTFKQIAGKSPGKVSSIKAEHMHRVSALLPKSKIDSGPSMKTNVVPAAAAIHKETSGSVKFENPEINPSSFRGTTSSTAKPSALRMPSPSVGFFNQEKAKMSHGNAVERNMGRFSAGNQMPPSSSSSDGKPALDDRNSVFNDSLHDEGKFSLPEETNTDVGTLKASTVTEDSLLHMECERNHNGMTESGSIGAKDLESSYVGERKLPVSLPEDQIPLSSSSGHGKPALDDKKSVLNDSLYDEGKSALSEEPNTDGGTELETKKASATVTEDPLLHVGCEPEQNMEDKMELGSNKLLDQEGASHIEKEEGADRPRTNTILRDHLKSLVPFTEEWLAVMEACGQEVLEQKSGAVQNSPPDKTGREPSPWSPVKRKAQDVGPFDCTKYSKSVRTSGTP